MGKGIAFGKPQIKYVKSVSEGKLKVSWNAVKGAQYYQVYRSTSKNGSYKKIRETKSTYYTNGGRTPGKVYYYKIRAVRKAGNGVLLRTEELQCIFLESILMQT